MNFISKVRLVFRNDFDERIRDFLRGDDDLRGPVNRMTSDDAMRYTAVFACVRVLSETLATLPVRLYIRDKDGDKKEANDIPIYDILTHKPNEEMTPFNFKEAVMTSLCLGGNGFAQKLRNKAGDVIQLYPIEWQNVVIDRDTDTKKLLYKVSKGAQTLSWTRDDMFHIPGLSLNGIQGLTPIQYAQAAINLGLTYESFATKFYNNGANSTGVLEHPGVLGDTALERLRKMFQEKYAGMANAGKPIILEDGLKYSPLTINPVDAQLLESKHFQVEDICRIYRVPQHLIQKLDRSTNNNIEHQSLEFGMYTMLPWFKRWEENIALQLMSEADRRAGYFVQFDMSELLRGDLASRCSAYAQGRQWGWLSVNDIRRMENMNPIANGDIYLQPTNMAEAGSKEAADQQKAMADAIYKMITAKGE